MQNAHPDVYRLQLLASALVNHRLSADEFQKECRLLTESERRSLYAKVDELRGVRSGRAQS